MTPIKCHLPTKTTKHISTIPSMEVQLKEVCVLHQHRLLKEHSHHGAPGSCTSRLMLSQADNCYCVFSNKLGIHEGFSVLKALLNAAVFGKRRE